MSPPANSSRASARRAGLRSGRAVWIAALLAVAVFGPVVPRDGAMASAAGGSAAAVIERYRTRIPDLMADQGIPGLAVAVVDEDAVLWAEGFGVLERNAATPVTADTMFGVQSLSKLFTATAVMIAVQNGLVQLDEPITAYVPTFSVNSAFERHPERKITLRMLLAHTAGFTHEAPIGNNFEVDPGDFHSHVQTISDTWLRFPVGTGYAYSNLGIDLAGYILEQVYDQPFANVMRNTVLGPLGMANSTFDRSEIRATANRARGHSRPLPEVPVDVGMTASGGLYASVSDLTRFLRFQLNDGEIGGRALLDPKLVDEMRTVPEPYADAAAGYALGVVRHRWVVARNADLLEHGGGGFGFLSDTWWLPEVGLGVAVLTNDDAHALQGDLALDILFDLTHESGSSYAERLRTLPPQGPAPEPNSQFRPPRDLGDRIADAAIPRAGGDAQRWAAYVGEYRAPAWNVIDPMGPPGRILVDSGSLYIETSETGGPVRQLLTEISRGLFIAQNGETLDFRGPTATWRNIELVRSSGVSSSQWGLLALAGLTAGAWLVSEIVGAVRGRAKHVADSRERRRRRNGSRIVSVLATLASFLTLATIGLIVAMPGLVDSGFIGWLELPLEQRLLFHLPLGLVLVGAASAVGWVVSWRRGGWSALAVVRYGTLTAAAAAFSAQLAAWGLIGWGFA